jgi:uncharacterized protein DUF3106
MLPSRSLARGLIVVLGTAAVALGLSGLPATALAQAQPLAQPQPPVQPPPVAQPPQPVARPQTEAASVPTPASSTVAGKASATKPMASAAKANNAKRITKPLWSELTPPQQQALAPLAGKWDTVSQAQKRKWLALSQNFPGMSGAEQAKLHSRMSEWVALTPQQRTQARLNFGETQQLSPDDKKAKWEAYQALPPEEKRKLAASAAKPPATAVAVKPVPPEKLAEVPKKTAEAPRPRPVGKTPRIATAPSQVDHNTLLPQPSARPGDGRAN